MKIVICHAETEQQRGYWTQVKEEFVWRRHKRVPPGQSMTPGR